MSKNILIKIRMEGTVFYINQLNQGVIAAFMFLEWQRRLIKKIVVIHNKKISNFQKRKTTIIFSLFIIIN